MNKSNSIGAIDKTDLSEQTKFQLDEEIKLNEEILSKLIYRKKLIKENHAVKN